MRAIERAPARKPHLAVPHGTGLARADPAPSASRARTRRASRAAWRASAVVRPAVAASASPPQHPIEWARVVTRARGMPTSRKELRLMRTLARAAAVAAVTLAA